MSNETIREDFVPRQPHEYEYGIRDGLTHYQLNAGRKHLHIITFFHKVVATVVIIVGLLLTAWLALAIAATFFGVFGDRPLKDKKSKEEIIVAIAAMTVMAVVILLVWTFAVCLIRAARSLRSYKRYTFCVVIAALLCALPPLGTILGLATILVLMHDSVKELFNHGDLAFQPQVEQD